MNDPDTPNVSDDASLVGLAIDEYLRRCREGTAPDVETYARGHPAIADVLRQMLPVLQALGATSTHDANRTSVFPNVLDPKPLPTAESPPGYELLEEIGRGGMGVVYRARQTALRRDVAVKMIRTADLAGKAEVDRFRSEALAFAQLQHPNIVQIFEVGEHNQRPFLALEYVEGGSLADRLAGRPQPCTRSAQQIRTLAEAMQTVHDKGFVHRDLKPANVLLVPGESDDTHTLKITDFGLVKGTVSEDTSVLTQPGAVVGTPSYLAPEQASTTAEEVGPTADVYALGAMLYEMIVGSPPFRGATPFETLMQVRHQEPVPPRYLRSDCPKDLETICLKCLQKEPRKRYESASALAADLGRFLDHQPIEARPVGFVERLTKWGRRNPALALSLTAALAILIVGATVSTILAIVADRRADEALTAQGKEATARKLAEDLAEKEAAEHHRAEVLLTASRLALAQSAWRDHDALRAFHRLRSVRWDHRGWEFDYLHTQFTKSYHSFGKAKGLIRFAKFSPDGRHIISVTSGGTIQLWDVATAEEVLTFDEELANVQRILFRRDGKVILTLERPPRTPSRLVMWEVSTGKRRHTLGGHASSITDVCVSPDGKWVVACGHVPGARDRGRLCVWDSTTGRQRYSVETPLDSRSRVRFSPEGSYIVTFSVLDRTRSIKLWEPATGKELRTLTSPTGSVLSADIHPDGRRIVAVSTDKKVRIWDTRTGEVLRTLTGHRLHVSDARFSPDGSRIVSVAGNRFDSEQQIKLWDAREGQELATLAGHLRAVHRVHFSPQGDRLLTVSRGFPMKLWNAVDGREIRTLVGHSFPVTAAEFSPDGRSVVSVGKDQRGSELFLWSLDETDSFVLKGHPNSVTSVIVSPDASKIVTASRDHTMKVWDSTTSQLLHTLTGHTGTVNSIDFHPTRREIVSSSSDGTLKLWDVDTGRVLRTYRGHPRVEGHVSKYVRLVRFAPDGRRIVSASGSLDAPNELAVWDTATGDCLLTLVGHPNGVHDVAFGPDGKRIISGGVSKSFIWDSETGRILHTLDLSIRKLAVLPRSNHFVAICADRSLPLWAPDLSLEVWDVISGTKVRTLSGDTFLESSLAVSPDGTRVASAGHYDLTLWDVETGLAVFGIEGLRGRLQFTDNGQRLLVADLTTNPRAVTIRWLDARRRPARVKLDARFLPAQYEKTSLSVDGRFILGQTKTGTIEAWDIRTGERLTDPPKVLPSPARTKLDDGRYLEIDNRMIYLCDPKRQHRADELAREKLKRWQTPRQR